MSTLYPNQIDNSTTLPVVFDNITDVNADSVNRLRSTILAIEQVLGINPQGSYTTSGGIRARLDNVDTNITNLNTSIANVITNVNNIIASLNGESIELGTPSGGFSTGITSLTDVTPITEAINTFNNIMFYMAPAQPHSIEGLAIEAITSIPIFSGKVADVTGHSINYFKPSFPAGSSYTNITKTQSFTLSSHNTGDATTGFSSADQGIINIIINDSPVTTFNLGIAFDENFRNDVAGQGTTYSSNTGNASPPLKIIDSHTQIYSIVLFNNFPLWQKGVVYITNTTLLPGYNTFQITHTVGITTRSSQVYELFYDNGATNPSYPSTPTLTINSQPSTNHLSGINYLTIGDSLLLQATINNAFVNTYLQTPITYTFSATVPTATSSLSDSALIVGPTGTSSIPNSTDHITISKAFSITTANQQTINQIATITYSNIYGTNFIASSAAQNLLINTYSTTATATTEAFVDEAYRMLPDIDGSTNTLASYPNDYVTVPPVIPPAVSGIAYWNPATALVNGNAQVFNSTLKYPNQNFSSGYSPTQGGSTNYSGFNNSNSHSGQVYYRAMYSAANPRSGGTLIIGNIILTDLTQMSPNVKVEMKLPGTSGWKDFSLPFNIGTFVLGTDGQGCRTGNSVNSFGWSMGTGSTATSGFMYILRITLFTTNKAITSLSESFTDTF